MTAATGYGKAGCLLCGGKGSVSKEETFDPPLRLGRDEFCGRMITSVGCECIWATCPVCGYGYLREDGHSDCCGFNPYLEYEASHV